MCEKLIEQIASLWPKRVLMHVYEVRLQILIFQSSAPDASSSSLWLKSKAWTLSVCPSSVFIILK